MWENTPSNGPTAVRFSFETTKPKRKTRLPLQPVQPPYTLDTKTDSIQYKVMRNINPDEELSIFYGHNTPWKTTTMSKLSTRLLLVAFMTGMDGEVSVHWIIESLRA